MSTHNAVSHTPSGEAYPSPNTANPDEDATAAVQAEDRAPGRGVCTNEVEELQKSRAQVESQLTSVKHTIESIRGAGGVTEGTENGDLQFFQDRIKQLEQFLEIGKKVDHHRQFPGDEQRLQASDTARGLKFYEELRSMTEAVANRINAWQANVGAIGGKESGADSQDATSAENICMETGSHNI